MVRVGWVWTSFLGHGVSIFVVSLLITPRRLFFLVRAIGQLHKSLDFRKHKFGSKRSRYLRRPQQEQWSENGLIHFPSCLKLWFPCCMRSPRLSQPTQTYRLCKPAVLLEGKTNKWNNNNNTSNNNTYSQTHHMCTHQHRHIYISHTYMKCTHHIHTYTHTQTGHTHTHQNWFKVTINKI